MPRTHQKFRGTIPDGDDDFVAGVECGGRGAKEAGQAEIADGEEAAGGEHDVGGFEVAVEDVGSVEVVGAEEELVEY